MAKLIFISGSVRKDSLNKKVIKQAHAFAKELGLDAKIIDLKDFELPIYDGDIEATTGLPENAKKLKKEFIDADGIFISTPEYNSSIPPVLKNAIDWISRKHEKDEKDLVAFRGKVFGLGGATVGWRGGLRSLNHLKSILGNIGGFVMPDEFNLSTAQNAFDETGKFKEEKTGNMLKNLVKAFAETAEKLKK